MSQSQLCENCQKGNHHSMQKIEDCNCECSNTIKEEGILAWFRCMVCTEQKSKKIKKK